MTTPTGTDVSGDAEQIVSTELPRQVYGTPDLSLATNLVQAGWLNAQSMANKARDKSTTLVGQLKALADTLSGALPPLSTDITALTDTVDDLDVFTSEELKEAVPAFTFTGTEAAERDYSAPEFVRLLAALDSFVTGDETGIDAATETALWDRGRVRVDVAMNARSIEAVQQLAIIGMSKAPDALALDVAEVGQAVASMDASYSRDMETKQADLRQSTHRFAFEQAPELQQVLSSYTKDKMTRGVQAARALLEATIRAFGITVEGFSSNATYHGAYLSAQVSRDRAIVDARTAQANTRMEAARENIRLLIQEATTLAQAIQAAANIAAQLAAASLSSVSISASAHGSDSWSLSVSDSRSRSVTAIIGGSTNNQYNYTP